MKNFLYSIFPLLILFLITPRISYAQTNPAYPLKRSTDSQARFLVDQNNRPFFINGDTPWSLIGQVSYEDAVYYINDAAQKGINSLIITLVEGYYADNAPANYYGTQPFLTPNKFSTPNPAYFDHADRVIAYAAQRGMNVIIAPNYLGCCNDGWLSALMNNNSDTDARLYGEFIGSRYKNTPNIIYVWGNDLNPPSTTVRNRILAMVNGVKSKDPNHLHTYHWAPENSAYEQWSANWDPVLDINISYTYDPVHGEVLADYNRSPVKPFFLFESHYERDWANASPIQVRRQAYNAVLSGAGGHFYGNNPIWHMNSTVINGITGSWKDHLNDEARADLPYIKALFESRSWHTLVPDQSHTVVTSGFGSGQSYVGSAQTSDQNTVIAYLPGNNTIAVNLNRIAGSQTKAWWYNPRNGAAQLIGTYPDSTNQTFSSPDSLDWLLVLDNSAANLPVPGTTNYISPTPLPSVTQTPIPTASPKPGDANADGRVDGIDYAIWLIHFGQNTTNGYRDGDYNSSGRVDGIDYAIWLLNFGRQ